MKRKKVSKREREAAEAALRDNVIACGAMVLERLGYTRVPGPTPAWASPKGWSLFALEFDREPRWTLRLAEAFGEEFGELTTGQLAACAEYAITTEPEPTLGQAIREVLEDVQRQDPPQ